MTAVYPRADDLEPVRSALETSVAPAADFGGTQPEPLTSPTGTSEALGVLPATEPVAANAHLGPAVSHRAPDDRASRPDFGPFGFVLPVLAGSSGAGASVFAALSADVLQQAGRCALLIDTADPARSGLASAAAVTGSEIAYPAEGVGVRWSWRGHAVVAQLETELPALAPTPTLTPRQWLPDSGLSPLHVTIVDVGHSWTGPTAHPLTGPTGWLAAGRPGSPNPCPVLVVRPTRPSLLAAEAALARLDPWVSSGDAVFPARLVVMGSWKRNKWPKGVVGVAGARVSALLDDAVFIPHDEELLLGGVTEHPTPPRAQAAVAELLHEWELLSPTPTIRHRPTARGTHA